MTRKTVLFLAIVIFAMVTGTAWGQLPTPSPYNNNNPADNCLLTVAIPAAAGSVAVSVVAVQPACEGLSQDVWLQKMVPPTEEKSWVTFAQSTPDGSGTQYVRVKVGDPIKVVPATSGSYYVRASPVPGVQVTPVTAGSGFNFGVPQYVHAEIPVLSVGEPLLQVQGTEKAPFAEAVHGVVVDNTIHYAVDVAGPTRATFLQVDGNGKLKAFQSLELEESSNSRQLSIEVPDTGRPVYVHLIDRTTLYAGDFQIYDPRCPASVRSARRSPR